MRTCLMQRLARAAVASAVIAALTVGPVWSQDSETVMMGTFDFAPFELHVAPGATVSWVNTSPDIHTVTADDAAYDSGDVPSGESFSMTFDEPGRYQYYCVYHGAADLKDMAGVVIVEG